MTFVILSGGIDLSVGSVIALTTMVSAWLVEKHQWSPLAVIPLVLLMGTLFGAAMGTLIQRFRLQPFIVTLAGMFLARGLCYVISIDSISIGNAFYSVVSQARIPVWGDASLSVGALVALALVAAAVFVAHYTQFGRTVYAIGGNESSAVLMGLPVRSTLIGVYTLSGFCSALAGVVFTFYMLSGYGLHAMGLELDAIAAVVIGGTLLSGGVGYVLGTLFGVLVLGLIQTLIMFDGTLSSWWTRIVIGGLLFAFCLLQRVFEAGRQRGT
jgi:simple sugar transport system permease protein